MIKNWVSSKFYLKISLFPMLNILAGILLIKKMVTIVTCDYIPDAAVYKNNWNQNKKN